jgi:hypothetical protein
MADEKPTVFLRFSGLRIDASIVCELLAFLLEEGDTVDSGGNVIRGVTCLIISIDKLKGEEKIVRVKIIFKKLTCSWYHL